MLTLVIVYVYGVYVWIFSVHLMGLDLGTLRPRRLRWALQKKVQFCWLYSIEWKWSSNKAKQSSNGGASIYQMDTITIIIYTFRVNGEKLAKDCNKQPTWMSLFFMKNICWRAWHHFLFQHFETLTCEFWSIALFSTN